MQQPALNEASQESPLSVSRMETFDYNLKRMTGAIDSIEDKCHNILNQRNPASEKEKIGTPIENDFFSKVDTRLDQFAILNDRLEQINRHLSKIVG